jgi:hypothetical protein
MRWLKCKTKLSLSRLSVGVCRQDTRKFCCHKKFIKVRREANFLSRIFTNGPAIWGGRVTRREHRAGSRYFSREAVTVQGGYGTRFCRHGTNFIACWRDRGTSFIGATNLSPVTNLVAGTGAVSRYKLSRRQKLVTVQKLNCVQMRALPAVASAKAGVRVQEPLQICLGSRSKSKNRDKQLTHIVRVS